MAPETKPPVTSDGTEGSLRRKTERGLIWAAGEALGRAVLQFAVLAVLARLLTPADYGVVGAALVIVGVSTIFAQLGVGPAVVQRENLRPEHLDAAFWASLILGIFTGGVIALTAPWMAEFFRIPALAPALRALSLVFPLTGISVVSESLLQRDLHFDRLARAEVLSYGLGYGGVGIALAWIGWGWWALVCAQAAQTVVRTALLFRAQHWRPRLAFDRSALRDLREFSTGLTAARLANYVAVSGDNLVVGRCLGDVALGLYGRAYALMGQPANLIGNVLEKVLFPAMSRVQNDNARLAEVYRDGVGVLATLTLPASAAIYLLAPEIVTLLLGPRWGEAVPILQIFAIGLLARTSMKMSNSLIRAKGAVFQMATCQFLYATAVVGFAIAGQRGGLEGTALGVLAAIVGCYLLAAGMSLRLVGATWAQFVQRHLPGAGLAILVFAGGWLPCTMLRQHNTAPLLIVLLATIGMALPALIAVLAFPVTFLGPLEPRLRGVRARFWPAKAVGTTTS